MNVSLLRRWLALSALVLFAATWRLWTPQTVFPQIPFFAALRTVPGWIDWLALMGMLVGLLGLLFTPGERRTSALRARPVRAFALLFVASLVTLVLLDQHRLQVWAYQFAIVAIVIAFVPPVRALSLLRLLTIGIYFWSAVSKLDYTFLHGLGPELLRGMLTAFGLEPGWMRPEVATVIALAFPLDELAVAALLAFRRTRTLGLIGSIAMHLLLLATLGPWGLDHSWGVLLWNVYFLGQNVLLFAPQASGGRQPSEDFDRSTRATLPVPLSLGRGVRGEGRDGGLIAHCIPSSAASQDLPKGTDGAAGHPLTPGPSPQRRGETTPPASNDQTRRLTPAARLASWVVYAAVVLPVLEPFGWLDHWPAWAVYAPAGETVMLVTAFGPEGMSDYFVEFAYSTSGMVRFDHWSLDTLSVPIYPDPRFQVGVALAVIERHDSLKRASLKHSSLYVERVADRFTGERTSEWYTGIDGIRDYADSFWLNTRPRKLGGW